MLTPFERGLVAHLVADWVLQNDWMARHKSDLGHPAAYVHAGIHAACLAVALGPLGGAVLGVVHLLVDSRAPVAWWMRVYKRCERSPEAPQIALWLDQALHLICLAAWVAFGPG